MALELHILPRAIRDIDRIEVWHVTNQAAVPHNWLRFSSDHAAWPGAVRDDVEATAARIASHPGLGARVRQSKTPDVRRFHLRRFKYWLYYRVRGDTLQILTIWHSARGKGPAV